MLGALPLLLDHVPDLLDRIQDRAVGGQEHVLELTAIDIHHYSCLVH